MSWIKTAFDQTEQFISILNQLTTVSVSQWGEFESLWQHCHNIKNLFNEGSATDIQNIVEALTLTQPAYSYDILDLFSNPYKAFIYHLLENPTLDMSTLHKALKAVMALTEKSHNVHIDEIMDLVKQRILNNSSISLLDLAHSSLDEIILKMGPYTSFFYTSNFIHKKAYARLIKTDLSSQEDTERNNYFNQLITTILKHKDLSSLEIFSLQLLIDEYDYLNDEIINILLKNSQELQIFDILDVPILCEIALKYSNFCQPYLDYLFETKRSKKQDLDHQRIKKSWEYLSSKLHHNQYNPNSISLITQYLPFVRTDQ